ncbi:hypothetical protein VZT92_013020 [Zoarces viviparus]|uniref:TNFR-Cys domain-containing protein n=1 Tax=Zoarces viviparus TaxID=48416 RepID=A0AAW1F2L2_ZOAVI
MVLFKLLIFTLTFYKFIVDLDARSCPKGHREVKNRCVKCPSDAYQPERNDAQHCRPCTKCDPKLGSFVKEKCTSETDTKCQCRGEFVPWESNSASCKCTDGYFNVNSHCQKWKECKCGVKINGTKSSDAICSEGCSDTYTTTPPTSNKMVSLITRLTSRHRHETGHTQRMHTRTTTTAAPGHTATYIGTGMALLILGIIGLLVLTAVTCKLHITPQPAAPKKDSLCRRPVEESGEGSLSSLKLIPGQH